RSAGHYVKMVHNGIEYGLMQLISETYDLMKRGLGQSNEELHNIYTSWNEGPASSYLLEITSKIFTKKDEASGKHVLDLILDVWRAKGPGKWTSQDAMDLQVPIPTIALAVSMRDLTSREAARQAVAALHKTPWPAFHGDPHPFVQQFGQAFYAAMI